MSALTTALACPALAYPGPRPNTADGMGNGRAEWDWFYQLPTREQNRLRYHMSPRGVQPDEWAHTMDFDCVETAMAYWQGLVAESRDEWADLEEPEPDELVQAEPIVVEVIVRERVLGLADLAEYVGAKRATAYKWQARGQLPPADLTVSGADAWYLSTVDAWHAARS